MAVEATLTEQMPFVGTTTQRALVDLEAKRGKRSVASVIRDAIDQRYGLVNGMLPEGDPRWEDLTAEKPVV
jgi:hypothetical protein